MNDPALCKNCKWVDKIDPSDECGYCRRYPPVPMLDSDGEMDFVTPVVCDDEFCGEFSRRLN